MTSFPFSAISCLIQSTLRADFLGSGKARWLHGQQLQLSLRSHHVCAHIRDVRSRSVSDARIPLRKADVHEGIRHWDMWVSYAIEMMICRGILCMFCFVYLCRLRPIVIISHYYEAQLQLFLHILSLHCCEVSLCAVMSPAAHHPIYRCRSLTVYWLLLLQSIISCVCRSRNSIFLDENNSRAPTDSNADVRTVHNVLLHDRFAGTVRYIMSLYSVLSPVFCPASFHHRDNEKLL